MSKGIRRHARENGLGLFFGFLLLAAVAGQAVAGWNDFNLDQLEHHADPVSLTRYVTSSHFAAALMENWQSEYLQFALFILATIWLVQRGSPESKELGREGRETEADQRLGPHAEPGSPRWARASGVRRWLYSNSLLLVMGAIWIGTWFAQSVTSHVSYNAEQIDHREATVSYLSYLGSADFWERTLQNWQSEFLAVGSFAVLAVYLRQRGSPESKPVGAPHDATSVEG
jgi:Domain of unknown function (DUF6766)